MILDGYVTRNVLPQKTRVKMLDSRFIFADFEKKKKHALKYLIPDVAFLPTLKTRVKILDKTGVDAIADVK